MGACDDDIGMSGLPITHGVAESPRGWSLWAIGLWTLGTYARNLTPGLAGAPARSVTKDEGQ